MKASKNEEYKVDLLGDPRFALSLSEVFGLGFRFSMHRHLHLRLSARLTAC